MQIESSSVFPLRLKIMSPLSFSSTVVADPDPAVTGEGVISENRCQFYLSNKRRYCANLPRSNSKFCGNHEPSSKSRRVPCPIDPSHSVFVENLDSHVKRCPLKKQVETLESMPYYSKGINGGGGASEEGNVSSDAKRKSIYGMNAAEFDELITKIKAFYFAFNMDMKESFVEPDACKKWMNQHVDREVPYQEKHLVQQVSIVGNMEAFGILKKPEESLVRKICEYTVETDGQSEDEGKGPTVIEFGAGRGYLTYMLADCYEMKKIFLVERRSYKLKADRSLRKKQDINLERLRIDIEDLDLHAIESLKGHQYLAIGKHLCGYATDLALRCCAGEDHEINTPTSSQLQGLAIATCCHHLCQWKHYTSATFMSKMGITKEDFHAITWFSSWAVDGDHSSVANSCAADQTVHPSTCYTRQTDSDGKGVEEIIRNMQSAERASLGFMCKLIIDIGRLFWLRDHGLDAQLVNYVPSSISPENHLLLARPTQ